MELFCFSIDRSDSLPMSPISTSSKGTIVKQGSKDEERKSTLSFSLQFSNSKDKDPCISPSTTHDGISNELTFNFDSDMADIPMNGCFVMVKQFSLLAQIGSLALCKTAEGSNQLIASQPNGGYCILATYENGCSLSDPVCLFNL